MADFRFIDNIDSMGWEELGIRLIKAQKMGHPPFHLNLQLISECDNDDEFYDLVEYLNELAEEIDEEDVTDQKEKEALELFRKFHAYSKDLNSQYCRLNDIYAAVQSYLKAGSEDPWTIFYMYVKVGKYVSLDGRWANVRHYNTADQKYKKVVDVYAALMEKIDLIIQKQKQEYNTMTMVDRYILDEKQQDCVRRYNQLYNCKISKMSYPELPEIEKKFRLLSEEMVHMLNYEGFKEAVSHCFLCIDSATERMEKLKPYYDEVCNIPGGYMHKKVKERAPEKLAEFRQLTKKRSNYLGGSYPSLWHLLLAIVVLVSGVIFCKEMMQGGEYLGIAGLYSTEGVGIQYLAFPIWTVALFLYLGIFNLWGILIVTHIVIPLTSVFEKLPFLHLIWPVAGLILLGLSVWSIWQDVMWKIYHHKAEEYYKVHILPIEDEIWKEVEEKFGDLVNPADRESVR